MKLTSARTTLVIMPHFSFLGETSTSADTIIQMLNEDDQIQQDEMTKNWRDHKLQELNFVGTLVRDF